MRFGQQSTHRVFGLTFPVHLEGHLFGPGVTVLRSLRTLRRLDMVILANTIPVETNRTRLCFSVIVQRNLGLERLIGAFLLWQLGIEFRADARVFHRKVPLANPVFTDGDASIINFRRWFRQFYESAPPSVEAGDSLPAALALEGRE
jgi:hypothetical protein